MKKTKRKLPLPAAAAEPDLSAGSWAPLLLAWYDAHRRDLPWRTPAPRDPYRVWVSEIMLQQTRVETARGYYLRWMEHFPDIASLAAADPDDVLRQWQGLGYYSRARNLQTAAQEIMTRYGGRMPDTRDAIRTLKGIGDYTAGAIASFAFGRREPAVDGNVLRVFARLPCPTHSHGARPRADAGRPPGGLQRGPHGPGRHGLHPRHPALRGLPSGSHLQGPGPAPGNAAAPAHHKKRGSRGNGRRPLCDRP